MDEIGQAIGGAVSGVPVLGSLVGGGSGGSRGGSALGGLPGGNMVQGALGSFGLPGMGGGGSGFNPMAMLGSLLGGLPGGGMAQGFLGSLLGGKGTPPPPPPAPGGGGFSGSGHLDRVRRLLNDPNWGRQQDPRASFFTTLAPPSAGAPGAAPGRPPGSDNQHVGTVMGDDVGGSYYGGGGGGLPQRGQRQASSAYAPQFSTMATPSPQGAQARMPPPTSPFINSTQSASRNIQSPYWQNTGR